MQIARARRRHQSPKIRLCCARRVDERRSLPDLTPLPGKQTGAEVSKLVGLMQRLLAPDGCPWDREQTLATLVPYLVEETYEVVDALADGDVDDHREELGDLLLQIVFQSELRFAEGKFGIDDVARGIVAKLVRRHPHVFGDVVAKDADAVLVQLGQAEGGGEGREGQARRARRHSAQRPALLRATRAGEKAGAVGFDWTDADGPRAKVDEELRGAGRGARRAATARRCSASWAMCCSRSPTWRESWASTPSRRCATRPIASRHGFATSSWRWRRKGARSRTRPPKSTSDFGKPQKQADEGLK